MLTLEDELLPRLLLVFFASNAGKKFDAQSSTQIVTTFSLFLSILNEDALCFILLFISPSTESSRKTRKPVWGEKPPSTQDHLMRISLLRAYVLYPLLKPNSTLETEKKDRNRSKQPLIHL